VARRRYSSRGQVGQLAEAMNAGTKRPHCNEGDAKNGSPIYSYLAFGRMIANAPIFQVKKLRSTV